MTHLCAFHDLQVVKHKTNHGHKIKGIRLLHEPSLLQLSEAQILEVPPYLDSATKHH